MGGKKGHVNPNKGINGSRRAAFHAGKGDRPVERRVLEILDEDSRFVFNTATTTSRSNSNSNNSNDGGGGRTKSGRTKSASPAPPAWQSHPNFALTAGMTAGAMREAYVELLKTDPGQLGKDKLRLALCQAKVPSLASLESEA